MSLWRMYEQELVRASATAPVDPEPQPTRRSQGASSRRSSASASSGQIYPNGLKRKSRSSRSRPRAKGRGAGATTANSKKNLARTRISSHHNSPIEEANALAEHESHDISVQEEDALLLHHGRQAMRAYDYHVRMRRRRAQRPSHNDDTHSCPSRPPSTEAASAHEHREAFDTNGRTSLHANAGSKRLVDVAFQLCTLRACAPLDSGAEDRERSHDRVHGGKHKAEAQLVRPANCPDYAGWTPLHEAVSAMDAPMTALLLQHGADANAAGSNNETPLHVAARKGSAVLIELLLNAGADASRRTTDGKHPVALVPREQLAALRLLQPGQAVPASQVEPGASDQSHSTAVPTSLQLYRAISSCAWSQVRRLLLQHGREAATRLANMPLSAREGIRPLHVAAAARHLGIVGDLLRAGAKLDVQTRMGNTPLHVAIAAREPAIVFRLLVAGANKLVTNNDGNTITDLITQSHAECEPGSPALMLYHLSVIAMQPLPSVPRRVVARRFMPLHVKAARRQSSSELTTPKRRATTSSSSTLPATSRPASTASSGAAAPTGSRRSRGAVSGAAGAAAAASSSGAPRRGVGSASTSAGQERPTAACTGAAAVVKPRVAGQHSIHVLARRGNVEQLQVLLAAGGVNIDEQDRRGRTALHTAVRSKQEETVRFLLQHGADPNHGGPKGNTPLHVAAELGLVSIARLLMQCGADKMRVNDQFLNCADVCHARYRKDIFPGTSEADVVVLSPTRLSTVRRGARGRARRGRARRGAGRARRGSAVGAGRRSAQFSAVRSARNGAGDGNEQQDSERVAPREGVEQGRVRGFSEDQPESSEEEGSVMDEMHGDVFAEGGIGTSATSATVRVVDDGQRRATSHRTGDGESAPRSSTSRHKPRVVTLPRATWDSPSLSARTQSTEVEGVMFEVHQISPDPRKHYRDAWRNDHLITHVGDTCIVASRQGFLPAHILDTGQSRRPTRTSATTTT